MGSLQYACYRSLPINSIYHNLTRGNVDDGLEPRSNEIVGDIVVAVTLHKHCLYDGLSAEHLEITYHFLDVVTTCRAIYLTDVRSVDGIEFQDVVIDTQKGVTDILTMQLGGVAEDRHTGIGEILVAKTKGIVDDGREVRMTRRLTIAGKGKDVRTLACPLHPLQLLL